MEVHESVSETDIRDTQNREAGHLISASVERGVSTRRCGLVQGIASTFYANADGTKVR